MQKNLNTKRFTPAAKETGWYVTIPGRFLPSTYKYSLDSRSYSISLVARDIKDATKGGSGRRDVLHFRASRVQELRERIEAAFPNAVFSLDAPKEADPIESAYREERDNQPADAKEIADAWEKLRLQFGQRNENGVKELIPGAEITWDMCDKIGIRKGVFEALGRAQEKDFVDGVIRQHKLLSAEMSEEERAKHTGSSLNSFMLTSSWKDWFKSYPQNFFSYPNNQYKNRDTILKYCADQGFQIPIHGVLDEAMRFLLSKNMFYLKAQYKRSEKYEMDAVREYSGIENAPPTFSAAQIHETTQRLRKALPVGSVPSQERIDGTARELGISDGLLAAIQNPEQQTKIEVSAKSAVELKNDLRAMRPRVNPAERRKGY
jgi:hypothetical protein